MVVPARHYNIPKGTSRQAQKGPPEMGMGQYLVREWEQR